MKTSAYITTGDLARAADRQISHVTYALQRHRVTEDARAGMYRLFRRERLPELLAVVKSVGDRKEAPHA